MIIGKHHNSRVRSFPKHFGFFTLPSCSLHKCIRHPTCLIQSAQCISQCSRIPSSKRNSHHHRCSSISTHHKCLGGQPPSLRFRQCQPRWKRFPLAKGPVDSLRKARPQYSLAFDPLVQLSSQARQNVNPCWERVLWHARQKPFPSQGKVFFG